MSKHVVVPGDGKLCPRCCQPGEIRKHGVLTEKYTVRQACYYARWYYCNNPSCRTTTFMCEEDRVWNENTDGRLGAMRDQLAIRQ